MAETEAPNLCLNVVSYYRLKLAFEAEGFVECVQAFSFKRPFEPDRGIVILNIRPDQDGNVVLEFVHEDIIKASASKELADRILDRLRISAEQDTE
jgi:hypothetical protein